MVLKPAAARERAMSALYSAKISGRTFSVPGNRLSSGPVGAAGTMGATEGRERQAPPLQLVACGGGDERARALSRQATDQLLG